MLLSQIVRIQVELIHQTDELGGVRGIGGVACLIDRTGKGLGVLTYSKRCRVARPAVKPVCVIHKRFLRAVVSAERLIAVDVAPVHMLPNIEGDDAGWAGLFAGLDAKVVVRFAR